MNIRSLFARIGAVNIANPSINGITDYEVEEFIVHENYLFEPDGHEVFEYVNDIGLLKLVQEVSFDSRSRLPACLQQEEFTGERATVVSEIEKETFLPF